MKIKCSLYKNTLKIVIDIAIEIEKVIFATILNSRNGKSF